MAEDGFVLGTLAESSDRVWECRLYRRTRVLVLDPEYIFVIGTEMYLSACFYF